MPIKGQFKPGKQMRSRYHKMRANGKQVSVHRYVMEQKLGRPLCPDEAVHHINGDRYDNRPENLTVMTISEHSRLENVGKTLTPEHKAKVSASLIGNKRRLGKKHSEDYKRYLSQVMKKIRRQRFWSSKRNSLT